MLEYIDKGETYHLFDDNLTKIERLLDEGVNIAKQLGIQSVKWNGLTVSKLVKELAKNDTHP